MSYTSLNTCNTVINDSQCGQNVNPAFPVHLGKGMDEGKVSGGQGRGGGGGGGGGGGVAHEGKPGELKVRQSKERHKCS